jgi:hypothetical protein
MLAVSSEDPSFTPDATDPRKKAEPECRPLRFQRGRVSLGVRIEISDCPTASLGSNSIVEEYGQGLAASSISGTTFRDSLERRIAVVTADANRRLSSGDTFDGEFKRLDSSALGRSELRRFPRGVTPQIL